jgi:lysophospholipase L1-like esterase
LLAIWEIYLRNRYKKEHEQLVSKYKGRELTFVRSEIPGLIYEFIANKNGTNSRGYLDHEHPYAKPKGIFRIVIIGDSVAQGGGIDPSENFGRVLERSLNKLASKKNYDAIILARSGYSTSQELIVLEKEAFLYHPDLIVWSYVLNDPAHPVFHDANGELGRYFYTPTFHFLHFIHKTLFLATERWKGRNCEKEYHQFLHCVYWEQVQSNVTKLGDISKQKRTPIIFLIHPVLQENKKFAEYTLSALHRQLREISFQAGLVPMDLFEAYQLYEPDQLHGKSVWHPNIKGHKVIGDYVAQKLKVGRFVE